MQTPLQQCLRGIRAGQTFRRPLDHYSQGELAVVLPKNIVADRIENPAFIDPREVTSLQNHLLRKGDILIVNRGDKFNTYLYAGEPATAVATTAFYVITPSKVILPEYLNWYLNQREAKEYLSANSTGSTVQILTKKVLEEMPIPLIPLEEQHFLCRFIHEIQTEQTLLKELISKREEFATSFIWEHIQTCL